MRPASRRGMTLIELLVAFFVFLLMIAALVSLTNSALATWSNGEARKSVYDRAQSVLDLVAEDLRNTYSENEVFTNGAAELQSAAFQSDIDGNRRPRLRLVRTGTDRQVRAAVQASPQTIVSTTRYTKLWEVSWMMDHDPERTILWRGVRGFDRKRAATLLNPSASDSDSDQLFKKCFQPVETGVLYLGFEFWTQHTRDWTPAGLQSSSSRRSRSRGSGKGPADLWDSTRREISKFDLFRRVYDPKNPDFVYPEIVRVTLVMEKSGEGVTQAALDEGCADGSKTLRLNTAIGLPDPPGSVQIDGEWILYGDKTSSMLLNCTRGTRGTKASAHDAGARVRFGVEFVTDVRVPAYREADEP